MEHSHRIFVVHVIHQLAIGGLENGLVNLINQLPGDRFRHAVVCIEDFSDFRNRIQDPGVPVYALHRSKIGTLRLRWRLFWLLRWLRPDLVHSRNLSGLDALLPARLIGISTLHSEHGFDLNDLDGKARKTRLLRRLHTPFVDRYVTVSRQLRALYIDELGLESDKVTQICNGVDTTHFVPVPSRRDELLPPAFQGKHSFVVGTVGRIQAIKDQATLLHAMAEVVRRGSGLPLRLALAVVGDGPLLGELRKLAKGLGIENLVWFTGARNDVADLLQAMDLFVLPSLNEGISNTLLEAMATGLPVLATAVGGNVELLEAGVTGDTFEPGDIHQLADVMARYMASPALCCAHGAAARQRVVRQFSLQTMVAAYQKVYLTL